MFSSESRRMIRHRMKKTTAQTRLAALEGRQADAPPVRPDPHQGN
jgi:hypothetical protein